MSTGSWRRDDATWLEDHVGSVLVTLGYAEADGEVEAKDDLIRDARQQLVKVLTELHHQQARGRFQRKMVLDFSTKFRESFYTIEDEPEDRGAA